jgi:hypothetical protein
VLKIKKDSEEVIKLDTTGDVTFSGTYRQEALGAVPAGELGISHAGDSKLGTIPAGANRDTQLKGRLFTNAVFPGQGLLIKNPSNQIAAELHADGDLYIKGEVTDTLSNPAAPGSFTYDEIVYAAPGLSYPGSLSEYTMFQSPTAGYETGTRDISDFANVSGYVSWPFDSSNVPINGLLRVPDGSGPFPLVLFVHGNHSPDENSTPGYIYLCNLIASHGMIAGTIDCNFLNGGSGENDGRAIVHLEHVRQFKLWNEQAGHSLYGKIDMNKVMIVGHSRGGEGVGHAGYFNTLDQVVPDPGDPPVPLDGSQGLGPYHFNLQAVVAIAPTDNQYQPVTGKTVVNDNYFIIHGSRDGDVWPFNGYQTYDRAHPIDPGAPTADAPGFKALLWVYRANHNYFNSVWAQESSNTLTRAEQENVAKVYINAIALAMLKNISRYMNLLKDHQLSYTNGWIPNTIKLVSQYQDKQRQFIAHYEEDNVLTTVSPPTGGSIDVSNITAQELFFNLGYSSHLYQETNGLRLDYTTTGKTYVVDINPGGLVTGNNQVLVLRVGQSAEPNNIAENNQDFTIVVSDGTHSHSLTANSIAPLLYPGEPAGWGDRKTVMQTLRIPLSLLADNGVDVTDIRQITLLFDQPIQGTPSIQGTFYLDEIQLSR